jgi:hypothetical protein
MRIRKKRLRAIFHSRSGKDVIEGFHYELVDGEAVPSDPSEVIHRQLALYGFPVRTAYGLDRVFPHDGDIFIRNLPQEFTGSFLWVELEEEDVQ